MNEENVMGARIKTLRQARDMTQAELADKLGVQFTAVNKWEHGTVKNIKQSTIKAMADLFNVTPTYLMGFDNYWKQDIDKANDDLAAMKLKIDEASAKSGYDYSVFPRISSSPEEAYLIEKYRAMPAAQQKRLLAYVMGFCKGADLDET